MPVNQPRCRISFAVAREAPYAVILREGPGKWTHLIGWDLRADKFQFGQWLKAKIPNFDLSPNGELLLYFVQSYRQRRDFKTWVALSRPPWFSALALWGIGDSWGGGTQFINASTIYIGKGLKEIKLNKGTLPKWLRWTSEQIPDENPGSSLGWKPIKEAKPIKRWEKSNGGKFRLRLDYAENGKWIYFLVWGKGNKEETMEITSGAKVQVDWDPRGRIIFSAEGNLYAMERRSGNWTKTLLLDLNPMKPETMAPPPDALKWPSRP